MKNKLFFLLGLSVVLASCSYSEKYNEVEELTAPDDSCLDKCSADQFCINAICMDKQKGGNECYNDTQCISGICYGIDYDSDVYFGKCLSYGGQNCETDSDCIYGNCQNNICSCQNHLGCDGDAVCDAGTCIPVVPCPTKPTAKCILLQDISPNVSWTSTSEVYPYNDAYFGNTLTLNFPSQNSHACSSLSTELIFQFFELLGDNSLNHQINIIEKVTNDIDDIHACFNNIQSSIDALEQLSNILNIDADQCETDCFDKYKDALEVLETHSMKSVYLKGIYDKCEYKNELMSSNISECQSAINAQMPDFLNDLKKLNLSKENKYCLSFTITDEDLSFTNLSETLETLKSNLNRIDALKRIVSDLPLRMQNSCFSMQLSPEDEENKLAFLQYTFIPNDNLCPETTLSDPNPLNVLKKNDNQLTAREDYFLYFTGTYADSGLMAQTDKFRLNFGECSTTKKQPGCEASPTDDCMRIDFEHCENLSMRTSIGFPINTPDINVEDETGSDDETPSPNDIDSINNTVSYKMQFVNQVLQADGKLKHNYRVYFKAVPETNYLVVDDVLGLYCDKNYELINSSLTPKFGTEDVECHTVNYGLTNIKVHAEIDDNYLLLRKELLLKDSILGAKAKKQQEENGLE